MKTFTICSLIALCLASVSATRVLETSSEDPVCAFYVDTPIVLSNNSIAKASLVSALKNSTSILDDSSIRFNNGTNDVAVIMDSRLAATTLCDSVATDLVLPESIFGSSVRILPNTMVTTRKCTYTGSCKWWWGNCQLYRTCGKGYVTGGMAGAGDLYGNPCTSSCRTKCYTYCQCPYDTSCYGKK